MGLGNDEKQSKRQSKSNQTSFSRAALEKKSPLATGTVHPPSSHCFCSPTHHRLMAHHVRAHSCLSFLVHTHIAEQFQPEQVPRAAQRRLAMVLAPVSAWAHCDRGLASAVELVVNSLYRMRCRVRRALTLVPYLPPCDDVLTNVRRNSYLRKRGWRQTAGASPSPPSRQECARACVATCDR